MRGPVVSVDEAGAVDASRSDLVNLSIVPWPPGADLTRAGVTTSRSTGPDGVC